MPDTQLILFVCEHGAAKSIVAAAYFHQLASEAGTAVRAIARGTTPDEELSSATVSGLAADGLKPLEPNPQKLTQADLDSAACVVTFCELPAEYVVNARIEQWEDVPPVSQNYEAAREVIVARIRALLAHL